MSAKANHLAFRMPIPKFPLNPLLPITHKGELGLKTEINSTYSHGLFTPAVVLSRKLIENLPIGVLGKKWKLDIHYISSKDRFGDLPDLTGGLASRRQALEPGVEVVKRILEPTNHIREKANSGAHPIVSYANSDDI